MLGALEESLETQRRFVADASHELRTPLTSMQTNIEVLKQQERLDPDSARASLRRPRARGARDARPDRGPARARARRRPGPGADGGARSTSSSRTPSPARGRATRSSPGRRGSSRRVVEGYPGAARAGGLEPARERRQVEPRRLVRRRDPRGRRAASSATTGRASRPRTASTSSTASTAPTNARSLPGSGLGLAIVREVAEAHGGSVSAEEAPGGGALLRLRLPAARTFLAQAHVGLMGCVGCIVFPPERPAPLNRSAPPSPLLGGAGRAGSALSRREPARSAASASSNELDDLRRRSPRCSPRRRG